MKTLPVTDDECQEVIGTQPPVCCSRGSHFKMNVLILVATGCMLLVAAEPQGKNFINIQVVKRCFIGDAEDRRWLSTCKSGVFIVFLLVAMGLITYNVWKMVLPLQYLKSNKSIRSGFILVGRLFFNFK